MLTRTIRLVLVIAFADVLLATGSPSSSNVPAKVAIQRTRPVTDRTAMNDRPRSLAKGPDRFPYVFANTKVNQRIAFDAQAITFDALPDKTYGDPDFVISAVASSGLSVGFRNSGQCSVVGSMVHLNAVGSCTITAYQEGDSNFEPAPDVGRSFFIYRADGKNFLLSRFGALGDGMTDDGSAFQSALDAMATAGGGTLFVPAGRYAFMTPVQKDFRGLADSINIKGVGSPAIVPTPTADGGDLSSGLQLVSEFAPKTDQQIAIAITGLSSFLIEDIAFIGTPDVETDALITIDLNDIREAIISHCEFYGLSSQIEGGAIVQAVRSNLKIEQSEFLGSGCNGGFDSSVVQNLEWKGITITECAFVDYGQRPELYNKLSVPPLSWVSIGNAALPASESPRREVVISNVFFDEGAYTGFSTLIDRNQLASAGIDLLYVGGVNMNVSNLGGTGNYLDGLERVLLENSLFGWSHNTQSAIRFVGVGDVVLDNVNCVEGANVIRADDATLNLTVINSHYAYLDSQAQNTKVINTLTRVDDPIQYVRKQFLSALDRSPDPAALFYWSNRILRCGEDAQCVSVERAALTAYLGAAPSPTFSITGTVRDERDTALAGVTVTLTGSQSVTTQTGADGRYTFVGLPTSGIYTLTPSRANYSFDSSSQTISTPSGDQKVNFSAIRTGETITRRPVNSMGTGTATLHIHT